MRSILLPLLLLPVVTLACSGCRSGGGAGDPAAEPAGVSEAAPVDRVVAVRLLGASAELSERMVGLASDVARWTEGWTLRVVPAGEPLPAGAELEIVAGLLPLGREVPLDGLPVRVDAAALRLGDVTYDAPDVALAVRLPDVAPERWLVTGRQARPVARLVAERVFAATGYLFAGWEGGVDYMLRQADWKRRAGRWRGAPGAVHTADSRDDFAAARRWLAGLRAVEAGAVTLLLPADGHGAPPEPRRFAAELATAVEMMARRLGAPSGAPLTVAVERDHPQQIRHTGRVGEAVADGLADVHLVYDPRDGFAARHALARVLLQRAGLADGLPHYLERGAALWLSGDWYGRPWSDWPPRLAAAGVLPTAAELLSAERLPDGSDLLWAPLAALVVERAPGATLADKLATLPSAADVEAALASLGAEDAVPPLRRAVELPAFQTGVSLAMVNDIDRGYHAPAVMESLDRLRHDLGANAVSLMPFAFQRDAARPAMVFLNSRPQAETDVAMIHAGRRAREAGLAVLWKPQIWLSRGWPGDVEMGSEEDWRAWWRSYRRFLVHQALLAEWTRAEMLCVGVELGRTVGRQAEWRALVAAVRLFFGGRLTYAANWYGDFEEVEWWDAVDVLGVDAYQPLADAPDAGREELVAGAREMLRRLAAVARREGKPLLMTEVGYAAHEAAWTAPHEEGGTFSAADQALAYEALFVAMGDEPPPWLRGMYLWKAFSGPRGDPQRADFRFLGRPAEEVVRRHFAALDGGDAE